LLNIQNAAPFFMRSLFDAGYTRVVIAYMIVVLNLQI